MTTDSWGKCKISDIKAPTPNSLVTGPFGSNISSKFFQNSGIPVIRGSNLSEDIGTRLIDEDIVFVSKEKAKEFLRSTARRGDLIFTCWGTIGQIGLIDYRSRYSEYIISNKQMKLTPDPKKAESLFLYYLFSSPKLSDYIRNIGIGSSVPGFNLGQLKDLEIPLPPLPTQHTISHIVGSLDDKIELNRQINETLGAMSRAIFQSWFVDFDPVRAKVEGHDTGLPSEIAALFPARFETVEGREVPRGWGVATLGDYIEPVKGLSYKGEGLCDDGIPLHNLNSVLEGGGYKYPGIKFYNGEYKERHIILPGDVIVTNTEQGFDFLLIGYPAIVPKYFGEIGLFTHHLFRVRPKKQSPLTNHFIYHLLMAPLIREQVIGCTNGTTVNMMYVDGLKTPTFTLPSAAIIQMFEKIVSPMFEIMENYEQQSRTLAKIRDALLPKLMSGELRVENSQCNAVTM